MSEKLYLVDHFYAGDSAQIMIGDYIDLLMDSG